MPWWRFWRQNTDDEQQAEERALMRTQQQKEDVIALTNGDIPAIAKERIAKHNDRTDNFFSSDLSVNEFLLMKQAGIEVVSQVMGTCYYNLSAFGGVNSSWNYQGEMQQLTEAQSHSRALAVERMQTEAKLLGADGVIGVRLKVKRPDGVSRHAEFTAYGTAVRIVGYPKRAGTFVSNLSGQEFYKLHTARYLPVGFVMGCCSYYVKQSYQIPNAGVLNFMVSQNVEIDSYTQSFYEAREIAMSRMQSELEALHADGAVGVQIDFDTEANDYEVNNVRHRDFVLHYTAIGTAICAREGATIFAPKTYIDLSTRKRKSEVQVTLDQIETTDSEEI